MKSGRNPVSSKPIHSSHACSHVDDHLVGGMFAWYTVSPLGTTDVPLREIIPAGSANNVGNYDSSIPDANGAVRNVNVMVGAASGAQVVPNKSVFWPPPPAGKPSPPPP